MVPETGEACPMRTTIFTVGSRGDVQPYVALGTTLAGRGLDVTIATHEPFREFVTDRGLGFAALPGDPHALLATEEAQELLRTGLGLIRFARKFIAVLEPWFWQLVEAITPIHTNSDAVLYSALAFPTWHLAQVDRTPTIQLALQPLLPTSSFPPITTSIDDLGAFGNRVTHTVNQQLFWQPLRSAVDRWRARDLGLPPQGFRGPYRELSKRAEPILHGFSSHLVSRPSDWPDHAIVTGHWPLSDRRPLPPDTLDYLDDGPAPVYVGFGSIRDSEAAQLSEIAIDAATRSKVRLVLGSGWAGLDAATSGRVHVVGDVDHTKLFPRMKGIVHHGGAGTTHTAAASGVPSMAVPYFADQPFWGRRIVASGIGAAALPRLKLNAAGLSERIEVFGRDEIKNRAFEVGRAMRSERGLERATEFVVSHLSRN